MTTTSGSSRRERPPRSLPDISRRMLPSLPRHQRAVCCLPPPSLPPPSTPVLCLGVPLFRLPCLPPPFRLLCVCLMITLLWCVRRMFMSCPRLVPMLRLSPSPGRSLSALYHFQPPQPHSRPSSLLYHFHSLRPRSRPRSLSLFLHRCGRVPRSKGLCRVPTCRRGLPCPCLAIPNLRLCLCRRPLLRLPPLLTILSYVTPFLSCLGFREDRSLPRPLLHRLPPSLRRRLVGTLTILPHPRRPPCLRPLLGVP